MTTLTYGMFDFGPIFTYNAQMVVKTAKFARKSQNTCSFDPKTTEYLHFGG